MKNRHGSKRASSKIIKKSGFIFAFGSKKYIIVHSVCVITVSLRMPQKHKTFVINYLSLV